VGGNIDNIFLIQWKLGRNTVRSVSVRAIFFINTQTVPHTELYSNTYHANIPESVRDFATLPDKETLTPFGHKLF